MDLTHGINPHQDVKGMVADYDKREAQEDADLPEDIPKEHMEPSEEAIGMIRKGRLNASNGAEIPPTSKTKAVQKKQFGVIDKTYLDNFDGIQWEEK